MSSVTGLAGRFLSVKVGRWVFGLLLVAALAGGCQSYRDGEARTVGELTDDSAIQVKVKTLLVRDKLLDGWRLDVDVERGVVRLSGWVATEEMRRRALQTANSVKGVRSVEDQLEVLEP